MPKRSRRRCWLTSANAILRYLCIEPFPASKETGKKTLRKDKRKKASRPKGARLNLTAKEVRDALLRQLPTRDSNDKQEQKKRDKRWRDVRQQDYKRLDHVLEACFVTWLAIYGREGVRSPRTRIRAVRALLWLVETTAMSGSIHVIKTIKEWAGLCRSIALCRTQEKLPAMLTRVLLLCPSKSVKRRKVSTVLLQASYIGRAMPEGGPELDKAALEEHYRDLRSWVRPEVDRCREFVHAGWAWGRDLKLKAHRSLPRLTVTSGATLTSTRGEGGLANDISVLNNSIDKTKYLTVCPRTGLEILKPEYSQSTEVPKELVFYPNECVDRRGNPIDYSQEPHLAQNAGTWQNHLNDYLIMRESIKMVSAAYDAQRVPLVKREIVREYGYKVRVVTKAPATLQIAGKVVRKILLSAMREWGPIRDVLTGDRYAAIRRITENNPPATGVFVSTDLSKATDKVSCHAMTHLWLGLARWLDLGVDLTKVGMMCLGVVCLCDEDIDAEMPPLPTSPTDETNYIFVKDIPAKRKTNNGILMGNPLTWLMLNFCQAICARKAWERAQTDHLLGKEWNLTRKEIDRTYSVCGDDLIAYWPMPVARLYEHYLTQFGFVTNRAKHFISPIGGVFTEICFFGRSRKAKTPLCQISKSETKSVTRVALAHMSYRDVATAVEDPADPVSRRLVKVTRVVKSIDQEMVGILFPGCFPIRGMLRSTSDQDRAITVGTTSRVLSQYCDKKRLTEVLRYTLRHAIRLLHRRGIVPEFPQVLGGADYWFVQTARRKCKMHRRAIAALCYGLTSQMDGGVLSRKWQIPQQTSGWWAMAEANAKSDLYADSAFKMVSGETENFPKPKTGILKTRIVPAWRDSRDPEALTSISRLFGAPNPLDRIKKEHYHDVKDAMRVALDDDGLLELGESDGLYHPDRLVLELALEYEKTFVTQMGPMTGGPGYKTSLGWICTQLRKEFKELVADWPKAKPVNNWQKAETALRDRMTSVLAVPAVYSYEPRVGSKKEALLGWHTSAANRGVYGALNWGSLLTVGTSVSWDEPLGPAGS